MGGSVDGWYLTVKQGLCEHAGELAGAQGSEREHS